jgi:hypothetical protein
LLLVLVFVEAALELWLEWLAIVVAITYVAVGRRHRLWLAWRKKVRAMIELIVKFDS